MHKYICMTVCVCTYVYCQYMHAIHLDSRILIIAFQQGIKQHIRICVYIYTYMHTHIS
jgi:hypothetical protein